MAEDGPEEWSCRRGTLSEAPPGMCTVELRFHPETSMLFQVRKFSKTLIHFVGMQQPAAGSGQGVVHREVRGVHSERWCDNNSVSK